MNIWLIKEGEELPIEGDIRLMRMGALAKYLSENGHKVVWWSSTFKHGKKKYLYDKQQRIDLNDNEELILLHSKIAYEKNVSLKRIQYQNNLAKEFSKACKLMDKPDIILCAWPNPQFAKAAIKYGRENGVPVVIDVRDQWPDIFERAIPKAVLPLGKFVLSFLKRSAKKSFSKADGITGMSLDGLKFGCRYAGREPSERDRLIHIGTERANITEENLGERLAIEKKLGIDRDAWNLCFFSTLSAKTIDLNTVILAVKELADEGYSIHLLIGGEGDDREHLESVAKDCNNVHFLGWLNKLEMEAVMGASRAGLYCMRNTPDFINTFSNKAIQYLSAGLPIINSLTGFAKQFLSENEIGLTYVEGDVEDCKRAILSLYSNDRLNKEMGSNAVKVFENKFNEKIVNQEFENYLKMIYKFKA